MKNNINRLEAFLLQDPDNSSLLLDCADAAMQAGDKQRCEEYLSRVREPEASSARARYLQATLALARGHIAEAAAGFGALLEEGVDNEGVRHNLAYCGLLQGDAQHALEVLAPYDAAPERTSEAMSIMLARIHHHLGNLEQAREILRRRQQVQAAAAVEGLLSIIELDLGNKDEAGELAGRALEQNHDNLEARLVAGYLDIERGDVSGAASNFSVALKRAPNEQRALMGAAAVSMLSQDLTAARALLEKSVTQHPSSLAARNTLAWCYLVEGRIDEAERTWLAALEVDRNFAELHGGLAVISVIRGDGDQASLLIRRAQGLDRECYSAWFARVLLLQAEGRQEKAEKLLDALLAQPVAGTGKSLKETLLHYLAHAGHEV